ncbi:MAG: threonine synthase [Chthoniobacterales bacterium]|nr:threonine synthase [Chthoniobacterales bacterium]
MNNHPHDCGVIARYREYLNVTDATPVVSLSEGSTPLIYSPKLSALTRGNVYLKYEGLNPTCSFKDRGMTLAMSKALERGATTVLCASTGNTSASAAAYAARAGMSCVVILPAGKIATGKMVQAYIYGATVISIEGNFDDALRIVHELEKTGKFVVVNSTNPDRLEGQKTAAFEIIEELREAPDLHILPVGNAGNITAYWKGYREFHEGGRSRILPMMLGVQAAGAAPLYHGAPMDHPETVATAIRIGRPASWSTALEAVQQSSGSFDIVTDSEILAAQQWLAKSEGIFAEPASVTPVAALLKYFDSKNPFKTKSLQNLIHSNSESRATSEKNPFVDKIKEGMNIVLTLTGHGLKDPDTARHAVSEPLQTEATMEAVLKVIGSKL